MPRLDIARLRKDHGMSQGELATQLQMTQSFLSAIENGRSPMPPEKEERLIEIFNQADLSAYYIGEGSNVTEQNRKMADMTDSDLFNQLLNRFHRQAHSHEESHHHEHHDRIEQLEDRIASLFLRNDRLMERNDSLASANDSLRAEIDELRKEIHRLQSLLTAKGIDF